MRGLFAAMVVTGSALLCSAADAACVRPFNFQVTSAGPWQAAGAIKAGTTCAGSFNSSSTLIYRRLYLASAPQHGKVQLQEGGRYFYSANKGYAGPDRFTLKVCGNQGGYEGCTDIQYAMTVE